MTIGPAPMMAIEEMSVRLGMFARAVLSQGPGAEDAEGSEFGPAFL